MKQAPGRAQIFLLCIVMYGTGFRLQQARSEAPKCGAQSRASENE